MFPERETLSIWNHEAFLQDANQGTLSGARLNLFLKNVEIMFTDTVILSL